MKRNTSIMGSLDAMERGLRKSSTQKSIKPSIMGSLDEMERGKTSKRNSKYSYIPYSKYAAQTEEEEKLNRLYDIIKKKEKDFSEELKRNKKHLEDIGEKAHEEIGERYNVPLQSKTSFKNTTGVNIGLNEKEDESSPEYGFFSHDFRGGKTKRRRTKREKRTKKRKIRGGKTKGRKNREGRTRRRK